MKFRLTSFMTHNLKYVGEKKFEQSTCLPSTYLDTYLSASSKLPHHQLAAARAFTLSWTNFADQAASNLELTKVLYLTLVRSADKFKEAWHPKMRKEWWSDSGRTEAHQMVHNEGRCLFLHSLALHCYGIEYFKAVGGVLQKYVSNNFIILVRPTN